LNAYLATITSPEEQAFVWSSIGRVHSWIGLTDEVTNGVYVWETSEAVAYANWGVNQPDEFGGDEDYVELGDQNGFWNDNSPWRPFSYICESP
jgi:hypothetical protein